MTEQQLVALLGRPLTTVEIANLNLYLEIAEQNLESLLCLSLYGDGESGSGNPEPSERIFDARVGYSTVFTGIFTDITSVEVDGTATTDYTKYFWDNRNAGFYNSIVFSEPFSTNAEVVINATWGFDTLPSDIQRLLAQLFANTSKKYNNSNVKSKQTEDFRVTYGDTTDEQEFINQNLVTIQKYSMCGIGEISHGAICRDYSYYWNHHGLL